MRTLLLLALTTGVLLAQDPPPTPRPDPHDPENWVCSRDPIDPAHLCACTGQIPNDQCHRPEPPPDAPVGPDDEGVGAPPEDRSCLRFCKWTHCHCRERCDS